MYIALPCMLLAHGGNAGVISDPAADDSSRDLFRFGGYYRYNVSATLSILSLNTILYSTNRVPPADPAADPDPYGQFQWLEKELQEAEEEKRSGTMECVLPSSS